MSQLNLYGELPAGPVVFAACDSKYFIDHAAAFAKSSARAGNDVHIHVINPTEQVFGLACVLNSIADTRITYTFNDYKVSENPEEARTLYACLRFLVLPEILKSAKKVLTLDIDCMVMKSFDFPCEDLGYFPRKSFGNSSWERSGTRVLAGVFYSSIEALDVCVELSNKMLAAKRQWYIDQIIIADTFETIDSKYSIRKFDTSFMDWEFIEGTVIWTGKGPRKYDNPIYVNKKNTIGELNLAKYRKVLLKPRLDIPFKKFGLFKCNSFYQDIRQYWQKFCDLFMRESPDALLIESPNWMLNNKIENYFAENCCFYVPHKEACTWGKRNNLFYMQTVFPWLFTLDAIGWGGGAHFINSFDKNADYNDSFFNKLKDYINKGGSKFKQPTTNNNLNDLKEDFIFVPLQIPHDMVIKYHSNVSCEEFVEALCVWADQPNNPKILFKPHPANLQSMTPLKNIIKKHNNVLYLDFDIHVHEAIRASSAVYVINSGVGQEAMLLDKPVVAFGHAEYSSAVISGDINNLKDCWKKVIENDKLEMEKMYRRWYYWYESNLIDVSK